MQQLKALELEQLRSPKVTLFNPALEGSDDYISND